VEKLKSPEVRFKNFNDEWSSKRLKDLGYCRSGVGFPENEQGSKQGIPFFKVSDMNSKCNSFELNKANNYVSELTVAVRKWTPFEVNVAIVFAKVGAALLLNRKRIVRSCFLIDNNLMAYIPNINWDAYFAKNLFDTLNLSQFAQTGALPSLNAKDIEDYIVSIPIEKAEQEKISLFQNQIDRIISLAEEKLTQTQNLKKAMLEKMFPKAGISFKVLEKNGENLYSETFTNSAQFGVISQRDFFDKDISNSSNIGGYYVVKENDFIYNPRISNFAPVGPIKRNKLGRIGVVSPLYFVFRVQDVDYQFLETYFETSIWHKFMLLNGDTGARSDRLAIKDTVFVEMPIHCPSAEEQKQVGQFFKQLDETLALQQQQLQTLKNLKQAFLEKMFV